MCLITDPLLVGRLLSLRIFLISYFEIGSSHFLNLLSPVCGSLVELLTCDWVLDEVLACLRNVIGDGVAHGEV